MKPKFRTPFMALVLAVTVLAPGAVHPPIVKAVWNGVIMPGRVLRDYGGNTSACRATAYGRVDNNVVLFVANHCKDAWNEQPYAPAYTNGGVQIGWWGNPGLTWQDSDLTYITLDVNAVWYPSASRNLVYRGDVNGSDFWTMTRQPVASDGCSGIPADGAYWDTVRRGWQQTMVTTIGYGTPHTTGLTYVNDNCVVFTDFGQHTDRCDSATPVPSLDLATINGMMTGHNAEFAGAPDEGTKTDVGNNGNPALYWRTFYEGLRDLDAYFDTHSTFTGAKLCITSSC